MHLHFTEYIAEGKYLLKSEQFSCYPHISAITLFRGQTVLGVFLDSETNGLNFQKHRVVEIAFKIVDILSGGILDTFESLVAVSPEEWAKSDPLSLKVNRFTW